MLFAIANAYPGSTCGSVLLFRRPFNRNWLPLVLTELPPPYAEAGATESAKSTPVPLRLET